MSKHFLQNLWADRIGGVSYGTQTRLYKFEKIKRAKAQAREAHPDVPLLDLGVGEPSEPPHTRIRQALQAEVDKDENHAYADNGCLAFKQAAAKFMKDMYQVDLTPETELCHCIGIKSALSIIPKCFINPGDILLTTAPGYPIASIHAQYLGGSTYTLPLLEENAYLPDLKGIPKEVLAQAKLLILNYPNNPTGAQATQAFYEEAIALAKKHALVIVQDAAYGPLVYEGEPLSILSLPGAKDVAVELHSLSKMYNMTGWRIGWVCGNADIVGAYAHVKDNTDSGQFLAVQKAAIHALQDPEIMESIRLSYGKRMGRLVDTLQKLGLDAKTSAGTFFVYVPCPAKARCTRTERETAFTCAESFSHWLVKEHLISTVPWDDVTPSVRFSLTYQDHESQDVVELLYERLHTFTFEYPPEATNPEPSHFRFEAALK